MKEPQNLQEWQEAVDAAEFLIGIDSARKFGLIETTANIDINRCEEIIRKGKQVGVTPARIQELCEKFL